MNRIVDPFTMLRPSLGTRRRLAGLLAFAVLAPLIACSTVLGIKDVPDPSDAGASPNGPADASSAVGDAQSAPYDGGSVPTDAGVTDASPTAEGGPVVILTPPPTPGVAGFALPAAAGLSTSARYRLVGTLGESPGGNLTGKNPTSTLRGGVTGAAR